MFISRSLLLLLVAFCALNIHVALQFGVLVNLPGPVSNMLNESFHLHYGPYLSPLGVSTFISLSSFAAKCGEFFAIFIIIPLLDTWGRRPVAIHLRLLLSLVLSVLSLLSMVLPSLECFILSLFLTTIVIQIKVSASYLYVIECCPDNIRGFVTILFSIGEAGATVVSLSLSRPSVFGTTEKWWMLPVVSIVLCLLATPLLLFMPETPKRLVAKGELRKAARVLRLFHGKDVDTDFLILGCQLELKLTNPSDKMTVKKAWKEETTRKVMVLMVCLSLALGISAQIFEMLFSVIIQMTLGISEEWIMTLNGLSRIIAIPLSFPVSYFIDRYGRRPVIFFGFFILYLKGILLTTGLSVFMVYGPSTFTVLIAVVNDFLGAIFTATGSMAIAFLLTCELTPLNARVAVTQVTQLVPSLVMWPLMVILPMTFALFPGICFIIPLIIQPPLFFYVYRNLPETKGRRVCDIVQDFDDCVRSRAPTNMSIRLSEERTPLIGKN